MLTDEQLARIEAWARDERRSEVVELVAELRNRRIVMGHVGCVSYRELYEARKALGMNVHDAEEIERQLQADIGAGTLTANQCRIVPGLDAAAIGEPSAANYAGRFVAMPPFDPAHAVHDADGFVAPPPHLAGYADSGDCDDADRPHVVGGEG